MTGWTILSVTCLGTEPTPVPLQGVPILLIFPADGDGEALAAATAKTMGAVLLGRITQMRMEGKDLLVTRNSHGGRLQVELRVQPCIAVATSNSIGAAYPSIALGAQSQLPIKCNQIADQSVRLEAAQIVIGGGRGLDLEGFQYLSRIACALDAAVSASLPAVDLGLAPVSKQVGQSGKFVNPAIYFAAGMSGTPQHFAGVGARSRILAVNSDREAPIFRFAEAGAVADAKQLLPLLAEKLEQRKGQST